MKYTNLTIDGVKNLPPNRNWNRISQYCKLDLEMLRAFKDDLNWRIVSKHQRGLTSEIVEEFKDYIEFNSLSENKFYKMSKEDIALHEDKLNWNAISRTHDFSFSELLRYRSKIRWWILTNYRKELVNDIEVLREFMREISDSSGLSSLSRYIKEEYIPEFEHLLYWEIVSSRTDLSTAFVRRYRNYIDWNMYFHSENMFNLEVLEEFADRINWRTYLSFFKYFYKTFVGDCRESTLAEIRRIGGEYIFNVPVLVDRNRLLENIHYIFPEWFVCTEKISVSLGSEGIFMIDLRDTSKIFLATEHHRCRSVYTVKSFFEDIDKDRRVHAHFRDQVIEAVGPLIIAAKEKEMTHL